jgi:alpha-beta hydrolase superfamily lysophospholipase
MSRKIFFRWLKLAIIIYCAVGILLYYLQDYILFHPEAMDREVKYQFEDSFREVNIHYDKETVLNIVQFMPPDTAARGIVLYFHGNRKNISWYSKCVRNFTKNNYEVWMMDYPGFGKSKGTFSEQKLNDYALQVYRMARRRFTPQRIIIYGKSFGTCIAAELAAMRDCKYLILETPYYSMSSLISHFVPIYPVNEMLHYQFPTNEYLLQVRAPVIIFQGNDDGIVPYSNASRLKAVLKPTDEFVTIDHGSHNNLNDFPVFQQKLDSLLR